MQTFQFRARVTQAGTSNLRVTVGEQAFWGSFQNLELVYDGSVPRMRAVF